MIFILVRAQLNPVADLVRNMGTEGQLERVKLLGNRADTKELDESLSPFEAAGTPLHSCRYISGMVLDGDRIGVSSSPTG